jgi:peptide/nickel transport system permease protein
MSVSPLRENRPTAGSLITGGPIQPSAHPRRSRSESPGISAARRVLTKPAAVIALVVLLLMIVAGAAAPLIAPFDPMEMGTGGSHEAPAIAHLFGTDLFGRDIFTRVLYGARISLGVAFFAVLMSASIGVTLGLLAGYIGGWPDMIIMRGMDLLLAFPGIFLALIIVSLLGTGLENAVLAVAISAIPTYTRTVRGSVLSARENLYVTAAQSLGCPDRRIMVFHILPNVFAPVIILMTMGVAWAILNICSLSFLGLGAAPGTAEWGAMLYDGRGYLREAWWATTFPGLAIMVTVMAVNRLGDGLRDALDPRLKL